MTDIDISADLKEQRPRLEGGEIVEGARELDFPHLPLPPGLLPAASGLYTWRPLFFPNLAAAERGADGAQGADGGDVALPPMLIRREELRLDVDRRYPQMTASGTSFAVTARYH